MKNKDPNYAVKIEQAIAKKYGEDTVQHPKKNWDNDKEKEYLKDLQKFYKLEEDGYNVEEEINGVFIPKTYSFKSNDDVYMSKFDCCEKCYIQWVEGREERWKNGWRPNKC